MIEVSILCLTYNHHKYIAQTLESFVRQKTDFEFEILVHDDASTDGTSEIIREYQKQYPDLIKPVIQTENQMSQGIKIVNTFLFPIEKGKYICFCEGDDYLCDDRKLQKQYDFLEAHPEYSACVHNTLLTDLADGSERTVNPSKEDYDIPMEQIMLAGGSAFHTSSIFFRAEYKYRPDAFTAPRFGDYPRSIYLRHVGKVRYLADVMSVHRVNVAGSWTVKNVASEDPQKVITHYTNVNRLLAQIDEYTEQQYHEDITFVTRRNECLILQWEDNSKKILTDYRDIYDTLTPKRKAVIIFKAYFPKTFRYLYNLRTRRRNEKIKKLG